MRVGLYPALEQRQAAEPIRQLPATLMVGNVPAIRLK
jgi:hypothetical protein